MRQLSEGGILSGVNPLSDPFNLFLVQAVIIIAVTRILSLVGGYFKQPRVIFEVIGGILLGPSALGRIPNFTSTIFNPTSLNYLSIVANIGLVMYLFLVGMELDPKLLAMHAKRAGSIAISGMALPFGLGVAVSVPLFNNLLIIDPKFEKVSFTSFYVFIGTAMSITAFPVLARILKETGLIYSRPGVMTMGAAALNDAVAWCLLILAISIANAGDMVVAFYTFLSVVCVAVGLIFLVRPVFVAIVQYVEKEDSPKLFKGNLFAGTVIVLFLCAWTTSLLGVHSIFGAFLFGLIIPRDSHLFHECNERIEDFVLTIMLPLYFALSGIKTDVTTINTTMAGGLCVLVTVAATLGKFVACGATSYLSGLKKREAVVVAVLMNTRGLIELIVLNLGVTSGILNTQVFSVMVMMCLATTFMTCPLIEWIYPISKRKIIDQAEPAVDSVKAFDIEGDGEPDVPLVMDLTPQSFTTEFRVSLALERMDQIPSLVDILYLFAPSTPSASLQVRAIQFIRPTLTDKDKFLGLENNRVIRVERKSGDLTAAMNINDAGAKEALRECLDVLPLSVFCSAVGGSSDHFRVLGNPDEFPLELKRLSEERGCDLMLMPWAPGSYFEQFFWSSVSKVTAPIGLVTQFNAGENPLGTIVEEEDNCGAAALSVGDMKSIRSMLVVISGCDTDPLALLLAQRIAQKHLVSISIVVVGNINFFSEHVQEAISLMSQVVQKLPNISLVFLGSGATDGPMEVLVSRECAKKPHDLILVGLLEPDELGPDDEDIETDTTEQSASGRHSASARGRSNSVFAALSKAIPSSTTSAHIPTKLEERNYRRALGMSEELARSELLHPELGVIGDRICRMKKVKSRFMVVLHTPRIVNEIIYGGSRRRTVSNAACRIVSGVSHSSDSDRKSNDPPLPFLMQTYQENPYGPQSPQSPSSSSPLPDSHLPENPVDNLQAFSNPNLDMIGPVSISISKKDTITL